MRTGPGRRALSFAYLVCFSVAAAALIVLGFAIERTFPASLAAGYRQSVLTLLSAIARPVDGLMGRSPEPVAGSVTRESAP